jgi:hypothetical protein
MPERLDEEELADWRAGRDAVYQLVALTIGALRRRRSVKSSISAVSGTSPIRSYKTCRDQL